LFLVFGVMIGSGTTSIKGAAYVELLKHFEVAHRKKNSNFVL
jgi:hypothetical protein